MRMLKSLKSIITDDRGQDLVEYALLLVFLALAAIGILPTLANSINAVFSRSASTLVGS